eukprot:3405188-Lingulodinium_polyedra.AAC.2
MVYSVARANRSVGGVVLRPFSVARRSARRFFPRRAGMNSECRAEKCVTIAGRLKRRAGEAKRRRRCF